MFRLTLVDLFSNISRRSKVRARRRNQRFVIEALEARGLLSFASPSAFPAGHYPTDIAVADFNRDGRQDIATVDSIDDCVDVLLAKGDGTFQNAVSYQVGSSPTALTMGDFNNDGNPDIVADNSGNATVSVLLGNGDGTFRPALTTEDNDRHLHSFISLPVASVRSSRLT